MPPSPRASRLLRLGLLALCGCAAQAEPAPPAPVPVPAPPARAARPPLVAARSLRFVERERRPAERPPESPLSLTASDGTGLSLVALRARGLVDDPLAFTELTMTFQNPQDRVIEGQFRVTLPPGASLSRFAMLIDGRWQEGEVVELQAARRAYEDTLHRRQDPALLEQAAGNEFSARVFPIPARGTKQLILSYSQELAGRAYALPLRGLPEVGDLDVAVTIGGETIARHERRFVPDRDFTLPAGLRHAGLRRGELVVARVTPVPEGAPDEVGALLVLVDTSASRALGFAQEGQLVRGLAEGLAAGAGPDTPLAVAAFDQTVELVYQGTAGGFGDDAVRGLSDRGALGASDLEGALRWAAAHRGVYRRVVLVSDGVATAGATDGAALRQAAAALGVERLDALAVGGLRDEATLRLLVSAGLPRAGAVIDASQPLPVIASRLTRSARAEVTLAVPGAAWSYPESVAGVQAGDEVLVYASVPAGRTVTVLADGQPLNVASDDLAPTERLLLERSAAQAQIAGLLARKARTTDARAGEELRHQITQLSVRHRVLSPYTALLVLETDADYARFQIDRRALADILTVGKGGLTVVARGEAHAEKQQADRPARPRPRREPEENEKTAAAPDEGAELAGKADKRKAEDGAPDRFADSDTKGAGAEKESEAPKDLRPRLELPEAKPASSGEAAPAATAPIGAAAAAPKTAPVASPAPAPEPPAPPTGPQAGLDGRRAATERDASSSATRVAPPRQPPRADEPDETDDGEPRVDPYTGSFRDIMRLVHRKATTQALARARAWHGESPGDVMALVAFGEALEASGDVPTAARAYGSLIDLFPGRADLRRFAGERLERLKDEAALRLAVDTYAKAVAERPDHPSSHRLYAFALVRAGRLEEAFAALAAGHARSYPDGRFAGADRVLAEDLGLVAAAWIRAEPKRRSEILARLAKAGGTVEGAPSLRFVLNWETDANDVDFHIHDGLGNHAFYGQMALASGGDLYADVTTGYGPECFTIRGAAAQRAYPYRLQAHYFSRGPMGYGMGKLEVIEHDGHGRLRFEERPFVVMQDHAFVELGTVRR